MTVSRDLLDCIEIETAAHPTHAVIWMHGLGADGSDFEPIVPELRLTHQPAVRFVFPNAPIMPVSVNNGMSMPAWYDIYALGAMPAANNALARKEDAAGIRQSQKAIEALIEREIARGVPAEHIVLAGFSQGCAMALYTGLRYPQKLAGIVALSGYLPLADSTADERAAENLDTPIFLAHGTQDPVVVLPRAEASRDALLQLGYNVQWHTYPMPHSVSGPEVRDISAFLRQIFV